MPTEQQENGSTSETEGQEQQGQQNGTTSETEGNGTGQQTTEVKIDDSTELPETHPLVKKLAIQKAEIASQKQALAEERAKSKKTTDLETELGKRPTQEALDTLQTRYDRLEEFLQAAGGPLSKALDSRTFTRDLFESDKDIAEIVKDWQKANPTATSQALGSGSAAPAGTKSNMNDLLRAAAKG